MGELRREELIYDSVKLYSMCQLVPDFIGFPY